MSASTPRSAEPSANYRFTFETASQRVRAVCQGVRIADSARAMILRETRISPAVYFPRDDVDMESFQRSDYVSYCPFKGNASHYSLLIGDSVNRNVMWSYEDPLPEAAHIRNYVAFYADQVEIEYEDHEKVLDTSGFQQSAYANPLMHWVLHEAPAMATMAELTTAFARQLRHVGMPLRDMTIVIPTLHPQVAALIQEWSSSNGELSEIDAGFEGLESPEYLNSPLVPLFDGAGGIRRRLDIDNPRLDFGILHDLYEAGATDYVAMPMLFSDGQINAICMSSDRPGGFSTTDLGHVYEVLAVMGRLYEVHALRRKAGTLLDTYLGSHAGRRVLNGLIRRGDGEDIRAVIWFCDLRGSTPLAQSMSRDDFLACLNEYFDAVAGSVLDHGGQILRFIGDAALAIFPIDIDTAANCDVENRKACAQAVAAAGEAAARIKSVNEQRAIKGHPALDYGIALHVGDVSYGNIGTGNRLEFTVIGDAANRAARIESLCKVLNEPVLVSREFTQCLDTDQFVSKGKHDLRGIDGRQEIFALRLSRPNPPAIS